MMEMLTFTFFSISINDFFFVFKKILLVHLQHIMITHIMEASFFLRLLPFFPHSSLHRSFGAARCPLSWPWPSETASVRWPWGCHPGPGGLPEKLPGWRSDMSLPPWSQGHAAPGGVNIGRPRLCKEHVAGTEHVGLMSTAR